MERKSRGYWNYETCYEAALDCKTRTEFDDRYHRAYTVSMENKWDKDYTWFPTKGESISKRQTKWTYEACYEAALDCKSRSEFQKKHSGAYKASAKNGWLDDYTWFQRKPNFYSDKTHYVYGYFFESSNHFYIGRTNDCRRRDLQHKNGESSVGEYVCETGSDFPEMTILESNLTADESLIYEDMYIEKYLSEGWIKINKAKTGLGCGSLGKGSKKWTYNRCFALAAECSTISEIREKSNSAYNAMNRNGWTKDYTWLLSESEARSNARSKWTYELFMEECKKCTSFTELKENNYGAFVAAYKTGWYKDVYWFERKHKPSSYYTKEKCLELASQCRNRSELKKRYHVAWKKLKEMGCLSECVWSENNKSAA